jgi:hypothetical protein
MWQERGVMCVFRRFGGTYFLLFRSRRIIQTSNQQASRYSGDSPCGCPLPHKRAVGPGGGRVSSGNTINELDLTTDFFITVPTTKLALCQFIG